ncbi:MAG: hypothetical protein AWM53_01814 [Candidatus Dichloromethanomonas elyunquensis]|nr:MAG: hypothetical protein AWM53_01814 [Candidatus Dichloromethanomonas elyunquensis]
MNFNIVIEDLKLLVGQKLESIRPGADIIVDDVNADQERVTIITASGKRQSRPLSELRYIWQRLHEQAAVHVDEALHGSGTSRNQPETLMANLPYIEWFKYNNKKHIALTGNNTHPLGTKKQMDEPSAEILRDKLRGNNFDDLVSVIVTDDLSKATRLYEGMTGIVANLICPGAYIFRQLTKSVLFTSVELTGADIPVGTYAVINKPTGYNFTRQAEVNGVEFCVKSLYGLNLMIKL